MDNSAKNAILAIGALAELCGELKRRLLENGFSESEALFLVEKFLIATTRNEQKEDN